MIARGIKINIHAIQERRLADNILIFNHFLIHGCTIPHTREIIMD